jgi:hypothetical protein
MKYGLHLRLIHALAYGHPWCAVGRASPPHRVTAFRVFCHVWLTPRLVDAPRHPPPTTVGRPPTVFLRRPRAPSARYGKWDYAFARGSYNNSERDYEHALQVPRAVYVHEKGLSDTRVWTGQSRLRATRAEMGQ